MATEVVEIVFKTKGSGKTKEAIGSIQEKSSRAAGATNLLRNALFALGGALSVREVIKFSDAYLQTKARIDLVTDSTKELVTVQDALFQVSRDARVSFESTAELYSRIARNADSLGLSQGTLLNVTEAVNQAIQISGVSATSANAAIVQLGQGLASGALRGDELRSVLEQVPRLAQSIADGLGVSIGDLRDLGAEGALTAEKVIGAIQNQAPELAEEFKKIPATFGSALTVLENSMQVFFGRVNESSGAVDGLTSVLLDFADFVGSQETFDTINAAFSVWALTTKEVSANISDLTGDVFELAESGETLGSSIGRTFVAIPASITAAIQIATVFVAGFIEKAKAEVEEVAGILNLLGNIATFDAEGVRAAQEQIKLAQERIKITEEVADSSLQSIFAERDAKIAAFDEELARSAVLREVREADQAHVNQLRAEDLENAAVSAEIALEQFTEAEEKRLERIAESLLTETELEELRFKEQSDLINRGIKLGVATNKQKEKLQKQHELRMNAIEKQALTAREQFEKASVSRRAQNIAQFLQGVTSGVATQSKTLFKINKAAAITEAVINGIRGVQQALAAYPPPVSFALAAVVAASAIANVNKIKSTQFGSGAIPSAPAGPGNAPDTPLFTRDTETGGGDLESSAPTAESAITSIDPDEDEADGRNEIDLTIEDGLFTGQQFVTLIQQINELGLDGARINARTR